MKKIKKAKAVKEREVLFKAYLIRNQRTQKEIADELGVESSAIKRSIERGVFKTGPFAEWWKTNILCVGCGERNERRCADSIDAQLTKAEVIA